MNVIHVYYTYSWRTSHKVTYKNQAGVYQGEGSGSADTCATVNNCRSTVWAESVRLAHLKQEIEERSRGFWDTKVWPGGVMEVIQLPRLSRLQRGTDVWGQNTNELKILVWMREWAEKGSTALLRTTTNQKSLKNMLIQRGPGVFRM